MKKPKIIKIHKMKSSRQTLKSSVQTSVWIPRRYAMSRSAPEIPLTNGKPITNLAKIDTSFANRLRSDSNDDAPQSVIHAPVSFRQFVGEPHDAIAAPTSVAKHLRPQENKRSPPQPSSSHRNRSVSAPSETSTASEATVVSPQTPENNNPVDDKVRKLVVQRWLGC